MAVIDLVVATGQYGANYVITSNDVFGPAPGTVYYLDDTDTYITGGDGVGYQLITAGVDAGFVHMQGDASFGVTLRFTESVFPNDDVDTGLYTAPVYDEQIIGRSSILFVDEIS